MPERFPGEHKTRINSLITGSLLQSKLEAFHLLAYQVSNNLIEDDEYDSELEDIEATQSQKIVAKFRELELPQEIWVELFSHGQDQQTNASFKQGLFAAAVKCADVDIVAALLDAGADPDQPQIGIYSGLQRPVQLVATSRPSALGLLELLIQAGANVDSITDDDDVPAINYAAKSGSLEMTQLLVSHGADYRRRVPTQYSNQPVNKLAALGYAVNPYRWTVSDIAKIGTVAVENCQDKCIEVFRYLLSLHDNYKDHAILRDVLVMASHHGRTEMIELLHQAGADVNEEGDAGVTPLEAAVWQNYGTFSAVTTLIRLGADVNHGKKRVLHIAAANHDTGLVQVLVDSGADFNATLNVKRDLNEWMLGPDLRKTYVYQPPQRLLRYLRTPLQLALHKSKKYSKFETPKTEGNARALLRAGASLRGGELVQAVDFNNETLLQELLNAGADVNEQGWNGQTALQVSLEASYIGLATMLLRAGAQLRGGELFSAIRADEEDTVNLLLKHGASLTDRGPLGESILEAACASWNKYRVRWALEHRPSPYDSAALCAAVWSTVDTEHLELIEELLNHRKPGTPDPVLEATAIGHTAFLGRRRILGLLLSEPQPPSSCIMPLEDYDGYKTLVLNYCGALGRAYEKEAFWYNTLAIRCSPLVPAILSGDWNVVHTLLQAKYLPDALTLLVSLHRCIPAQIMKLIAYGADVNIRARHDLDTPLQLAVRWKRENVVQTLLEHGADVNAPAPSSVPTQDLWNDDPNELVPRTALQLAVEHGQLKIIDMLLAAGADVNGQPSREAGATALQLAAMKGYLGLAKRLVDLGAEVNAPRAAVRGRTALEGAAEQGRLDMVWFLMENGANTQEGGVTQYHRAIRFARRNGHRTVAQLLEESRDWTAQDYDWSRCEGLLEDNFEEYYEDY